MNKIFVLGFRNSCQDFPLEFQCGFFKFPWSVGKKLIRKEIKALRHAVDQAVKYNSFLKGERKGEKKYFLVKVILRIFCDKRV